MSVVEKSTFRRNFQRWVQMNYGENSRTKTITRNKYNKICRYLLGEPLVETDAKFRFWVKSKGFRIVQSEDMSLYGTLYVPVKVPHTRVRTLIVPRCWIECLAMRSLSDILFWLPIEYGSLVPVRRVRDGSADAGFGVQESSCSGWFFRYH